MKRADGKLIIGLCGRSGSGKSVCAGVFLEHGFYVIDSDDVYRELLEESGSPLLDELKKTFGSDIVSDDKLDRKKLSEIVFKDRSKLEKLNEITHSAISERIEYIITASDRTRFIVQAPLLFESGFQQSCDITIGIIAEDDFCIERIMKRDAITEQEAKTRLSHQVKNDFLIENCDQVIYNNKNLSEFLEECRKAVKNYQQ